MKNNLKGLVPAIIQNATTGQVLMLGYMNQIALKKTLKERRVWFYSRSKRRLWMKGEVSKNILNFVSAKWDCDSDALLIKVIPAGPTCHTNAISCFSKKQESFDCAFAELFETILDRKRKKPAGSYTAYLFKKGLSKICAKVAEESKEVIKAAKKETKKRLIEESVDLFYHTFVLLAQKGLDLGQLADEMRRRRK